MPVVGALCPFGEHGSANAVGYLGGSVKFKVLSHACLLVSTETTSIVIDPWLLGSCYWRSWWNFPRASYDEDELAKVDAVVISHVHWDHWHGPTLKRFFAGKPVIVPDEPGGRSANDLAVCGFDDITRIAHGRKISVGDIDLTLYQFGPFLNDAAIVIEADGLTLLNANDAKVAGLSLDQILARHRPIDFAFRSHSSANTRICFSTASEPDRATDDRDHYMRSFALFMNRVKPRFAVPFASNHCHLNDDVFDLNAYITNPLELRGWLDARPARRDWRLQVMMPGSSWSSGAGFDLQPETPFDDPSATLAQYRANVEPALARTRAKEEAVRIGRPLLDRMGAMLAYAPLGRRSSGQIRVVATWPSGRTQAWDFDEATGHYVEAAGTEVEKGRPVLRFPAAVLRDAIVRNMFQHAGISKRCRFVAEDATDMRRLVATVARLERHELGLYPLRLSYLRRIAKAYVARWRELLVYASAGFRLKIKRQPIYLVEESILEGRW